jgi:hypothetical protein
VRKPPAAPAKLPPKRPVSKGAPTELDEVERALSVLDGRHPDFVRAQRETREAARIREQTLRVERARAWRRRAKAVLVTLAILGAAAAGGWWGLGVFGRARSLSAALDAASVTFTAGGFVVVASSNLVTPHKLQVQGAASTCFIAVTSAPAGDLIVSHGGALARHAHSIGWCACEPEPVEVTAPEGATPTQGIRLYSADARVVGGPQGWALTGARPEAVTPGGDECQESVLVSWIAARRFPRESIDTTWLARGAGTHLSDAGFKAAGGSSLGRTFAVVEAMPGNCMLAVRPDAPTPPDPLILEDSAGATLTRGTTLLWCDPHGRALTVRSSGRAVVLVIAAPAARVGGLLGAREWAARARIPDPTTYVTKADLALDAATSLEASGLPDVVAGQPQPQMRFVSVSLQTAAGLVRDPPPRGTLLACAPSLDSGKLESICAQVGAQPWLAAAGEPLGLAAGPTPFWLAALDDHLDKDALQAELKLLALARRLTSERFEVTMFSGVSELSTGRITVLGRVRDDAIVAVEIATAPPWVMPYSDGAPWTLDGEPREVPLAPEAHVTLTATPRPDVEPKQRRTIVFRRAQLP